ncbi:hypothetical protein ACFPJ1_40740 [Kribbella qitaiheensis]|uniref:hypothetical protein n=1 Tax=Kribbella qitaiheensis TaxID=1544730 RepID=UPI003620F21A
MRDLIGITYDGVSGGPELTAAEWRQAETSLFLRASNDLVISGVRGGAVSNTGFSVTIAPLTVAVQPSASTGVYRAAFPAGAAELAKTISAAHATLPRVDAIDVKVYDHEADASSLRGADIVYTAGTAAGSPTAPAFAGQGVRLGTFAVPASGGGNPVWTINPALIGYASAGGILEVSSRPSSPRPGTAIFNRSTGVMEYYNGTAWVTLPNGLATVRDDETADEAAYSGATWIPGSTPCAVAFTAPPSGAVMVHMKACILSSINDKAVWVDSEIKTGASLGSGSVVSGGTANNNDGIVLGGTVTSGVPLKLDSGTFKLVSGLTPGNSYNARVMYATEVGGNITILYRQLVVVPL